jgi:hypothetical protein
VPRLARRTAACRAIGASGHAASRAAPQWEARVGRFLLGFIVAIVVVLFVAAQCLRVVF